MRPSHTALHSIYIEESDSLNLSLVDSRIQEQHRIACKFMHLVDTSYYRIDASIRTKNNMIKFIEMLFLMKMEKID